MKDIDFSNIELSLREKATLRFLSVFSSNRYLSYQTLSYLHQLGLLDRCGGVYMINRHGKMYFRIKRKERLRFIIPTAISVVALLAGYDVCKIPLVDEILSGTMRFLTHILESWGILP